jgi:hypothetical protein
MASVSSWKQHVLLAAAFTLVGCAALRQNLRGQDLSFRGAWFCPKAGCKEAEMKRSTRGSRRGETSVSKVKLQPAAALAFWPEAEPSRLEASVKDCKGKSAQVDASRIKRPGEHGIKDSTARQSFIVLLERDAPAGLTLKKKGDCAIWTVTATAHWDDGATYSLQAAIDISG